MDGQTLISGATDNQVLVWNIPSRQLVKTMLFKGSITNLKIRLTNPAVFHPEHKQPHVFGANLKRMIDPSEQDEDQVIEIMVSHNYGDNEEDADRLTYSRHSSYNALASSSSSGLPSTTVASSSTENQEELESLRKEVQKLKRINKRLFEVSSKQLLRHKKNNK